MRTLVSPPLRKRNEPMISLSIYQSNNRAVFLSKLAVDALNTKFVLVLIDDDYRFIVLKPCSRSCKNALQLVTSRSGSAYIAREQLYRFISRTVKRRKVKIKGVWNSELGGLMFRLNKHSDEREVLGDDDFIDA